MLDPQSIITALLGSKRIAQVVECGPLAFSIYSPDFPQKHGRTNDRRPEAQRSEKETPPMTAFSLPKIERICVCPHPVASSLQSQTQPREPSNIRPRPDSPRQTGPGANPKKRVYHIRQAPLLPNIKDRGKIT